MQEGNNEFCYIRPNLDFLPYPNMKGESRRYLGQIINYVLQMLANNSKAQINQAWRPSLLDL